MKREKLKAFFKLHTVASKVLLIVLISGAILYASISSAITYVVDQQEKEMMTEQLKSNLQYLSDLIGEGDWSIQDGCIYKGDVRLGDGTLEVANTEPFRKLQQNTSTFSYVFMKTDNDDELTWVGDKKTGYQQGHYIRVAGSTKGMDGQVIIGTYIDKTVADILDKEGYFSGAANVAGTMVYCYYQCVYDASGNAIGILVDGREVSELENATKNLKQGLLLLLGIMLILAFALILNRTVKWSKSLARIDSYLDEVGSGEFPEEPLDMNSKDELGHIGNSINQMVDSLKEKERISAELSIATDIQANMLPNIFPPFPEHDEFSIFATMEPAKEVGGDFYDMYMVDQKHLAIAVGDVSGKGVPAALFMVIAKILMKNHAQSGLEPNEVFTRMNHSLCEGNDTGYFVTAWMGVLNLETGELHYANAGHTPPLLRQKDGTFHYVKNRPGLVLGAMDGMKYKLGTMHMDPGDRLFLYTDGVTETMNEANELYGPDRLADYLTQHGGDDIYDLLLNLRQELADFAGTAAQFDDITMLLMEFRKAAHNTDFTEQTFPASDAELASAIAFVEQELEKTPCKPKDAMQISLAVEELFVNIAHYAYIGQSGNITIGTRYKDNVFSLQFTDSGIPFNPLDRDEPDISQKAEDRTVGGLGIFLVKKTMDDLSYQQKDGQNILTLQKRI